MNDKNKQTAIHKAQLDQLLATTTRTLLVSTAMAIILAYMQKEVVSHHLLIIWLITIIVTNGVRLAFTVTCLNQPNTDPKKTKNRLNLFRAGVIVGSLLWGTIGFFMVTPDQPRYQMLVIYMLTGLSAGAVISYSVDIVCAMAYTLLSLPPLLLRLFWFGDDVSIAMSVAGFLYAGYMVASIRNFNRNIIDSIMLRFNEVQREDEIKQLAFYDPLTNLPNRRLLMERLDHALSVSVRSGRRGALLFLDLDHFKMLNDTQGHDMGDLLLKKVAERLLGCVRESDTVARLGGDEFVVMLEDLSEDSEEAAKQVEKVADLIIETLNVPYLLNTLEHHSTPSIGAALFGDHGHSQDELLKHADFAMYQAKKAGRNVVRHFDFKMLDAVDVSHNQHIRN
jgi:diguanylate cyclase (GGDEF)-like protein